MNDSVAKIDAYRARRMGEMLVSPDQVAEFTEEPRDLLLDLSKLDGRELLEQYRAKNAKFATAPFDPEGDRIRFYPGGVTIWSGYIGAGKTTLLRQFICHTLMRGSSIFVASLEEDPRDIPVELASVAAGRDEATAHQVQWLLDAYNERLRIWSLLGLAKRAEMIGAVQYLARKGIKHFLIDSLMRLDIPTKDYDAQCLFANSLATIARIHGIHIHLVAHPRKPGKDVDASDPYEIGGAREIVGIADNVIAVQRSDKNEHYGNADATPMRISIGKQRKNKGRLGSIEGWFHRNLRQYHYQQFPDAPTRYLPPDAYVEVGAA